MEQLPPQGTASAPDGPEVPPEHWAPEWDRTDVESIDEWSDPDPVAVAPGLAVSRPGPRRPLGVGRLAARRASTGPAERARVSAIGRWAVAAIEREPRVIAWRAEHLASVHAWALETGRDSVRAGDLVDWVDHVYAGEGGADMVASVRALLALAHAEQTTEQQRASTVSRMLPDGRLLAIRASELPARPGVVTLHYREATGAPATSEVLRDGRLGQLATATADLAARYLVPQLDLLATIVTGAPASPVPIRVGMRFRRFWVDGVPVTATSRVRIEVDPQVEPAELAHTLARFREAHHVSAKRPSLRLAALAADLVNRVAMTEPPDGSGPALVGVSHDDAGLRGRPIIARPDWGQLARDLGYEPRAIKRGVAAALRLLIPVDWSRNSQVDPAG
jgi:hypothetical protein